MGLPSARPTAGAPQPLAPLASVRGLRPRTPETRPAFPSSFLDSGAGLIKGSMIKGQGFRQVVS